MKKQTKNKPIEKWKKELNKHFNKEDVWITNMHKKDAQQHILISN